MLPIVQASTDTLTQPGAPLAYVAHVNEASMAEAMKSMAVEGHGVVWLPRSLIAPMVAAGAIGEVRKVVVDYHQGWLATRLEGGDKE